jgi:futalosine hydrolase
MEAMHNGDEYVRVVYILTIPSKGKLLENEQRVDVNTMILALAATQIEMQPFLAELADTPVCCETLVTGVGPVETAVRLTRYLCASDKRIHAVVNFGIGGAYHLPGGRTQPALLDICLAESEVFGDVGICLPEGMAYLDRSLTGEIEYPLDARLRTTCQLLLAGLGMACHTGVFITVAGISGTRRRGEMLRARWQGLCENMEGAAIARVCREFSIPCLELRAVSNSVEDRNPANWQLPEACRKAARTAALIIKGMSA